MAVTRLTPPLSACGLWVLQSPWVASPKKVYTSKAIRLFQDLLKRNVDIMALAYTPYGGTQAQYDEDVAAGAAIVTIFADDGTCIYVPDTRIVSYPNMGDYSYKHVVLSCSLGGLPDRLALDWMNLKLKELVQNTLGVDAEVNIHQGAVTDVLTQEEADRVEAARAAKIEAQVTYTSQITSLTNELSALQVKADAYLALLRANNLM